MYYSDKYHKDKLHNLITYNQETGEFLTPSGKLKSIYFDSKGYAFVSVKGKKLLAHRLAWALTHGECPKMHIDHIDGNKANNRISNLRICTHNQNQHNQGIRKTNKSGFKGVSWMKSVNKWQAQICSNSKVKHLGFYSSPEDAAKAYDLAAIEIHGEFAWTNFPKESYQDAA